MICEVRYQHFSAVGCMAAVCSKVKHNKTGLSRWDRAHESKQLMFGDDVFAEVGLAAWANTVAMLGCAAIEAVVTLTHCVPTLVYRHPSGPSSRIPDCANDLVLPAAVLALESGVRGVSLQHAQQIMRAEPVCLHFATQ